GDYVMWETKLLPGTAFVELALAAAAEVGLACVEELELEAPLALPAEGATAIQVHVEKADGESARRRFTIHSCSAEGGEDAWIRHASGVLCAARRSPAFDLKQWPPERAEAVSVEEIYPGLAAAGLAYGESFRGLRMAWRRGRDHFAEVAL